MRTALEFLNTHREVAFATCEGNLPHLRVFQIMKIEGNRLYFNNADGIIANKGCGESGEQAHTRLALYFATSPKKQVWQQLQENPNIEVLATDGVVSVRCAGMVNAEVDDATKRWIYDNNPVLPRLYEHYVDLVYFVLPIAEMDYYDLAHDPPVFRHFDLIIGDTQ